MTQRSQIGAKNMTWSVPKRDEAVVLVSTVTIVTTAHGVTSVNRVKVVTKVRAGKGQNWSRGRSHCPNYQPVKHLIIFLHLINM